LERLAMLLSASSRLLFGATVLDMLALVVLFAVHSGGSRSSPCCHRTAMEFCKFHYKLGSTDEDYASFSRDDSNEY
jgi:hypothetical protein